MDAKQTLTIALKALIEIKEALSKSIFIDLLMGKENNKITECQYDETDAFGSGEEHDEEFWNNLIDGAISAGYIKTKTIKSQNLAITAAGKKYLKQPVPFELKEEEEFNGDIKEDGLDDLLSAAINEKGKSPQKEASSKRSRQQIKIIQAIDRKIALDDFAENEGIELDVILTELEDLVQMKMRIDISYFTNEVLGENYVEELIDFFTKTGNDSIENALKEYGDVYSPEEIRLARIIFRSNNINK